MHGQNIVFFLAGAKNKKKNLIPMGPSLTDGENFVNDHPPKKKSHKNKQSIPPTLEDNIAASLQNSIPQVNDEGPFKVSTPTLICN